MATNPSSTTTPTRRLYHGSCHCGHTKYCVYLTFPPTISANPPPDSSIRIYKCNCSTCLKMSHFHVRPIDPPDDFFVLAPLNPTMGGLNDYTCFEKNVHWYFCGTCGVRCFHFAGEGEVKEVEIEGEKKEAWTIKRLSWDGNASRYLSINGATLEPGQEGLNLKEWTEKGWIAYCNVKNDVGEFRLGKPHEGGMF